MKLIISQHGIKRQIEGSFAMCCGADDLDTLIQELQRQRAGMTGYGWFKVDASHPCDAPANTRPLAWTEAGNINPPSR